MRKILFLSILLSFVMVFSSCDLNKAEYSDIPEYENVRPEIVKTHKKVGVHYLTWFTPSYNWGAVWNVTGEAPERVEPVIGFYESDYETGKIHGEMLRDMGVSFAMVDATNNTVWGPGHPQAFYRNDPLYENAKEVIRGFSDVEGGPEAAMLLTVTNWDSDTTMVQRPITYNYDEDDLYMFYPWIPSNAGDLFKQKVSMVYNDLVASGLNYFHIEGKPALFLFVSSTGTILDENDQDITPEGKLPDSWDPVIPDTGGKTIRELFNIRWVGAFMSASNNPKFVSQSGDRTKAFRGHWSWEDGYPQTWAARKDEFGVTPESMTVSAFSRLPSEGRNEGRTFMKHWRRVFDVNPLFPVIHTWNEFSGGHDEASPEFSQSIEPTVNYFGDKYYNMSKEYIEHLKKPRYDLGVYNTIDNLFTFKSRSGDFDEYTLRFSFESSYKIDFESEIVQVMAGDISGNGGYDLILRNPESGNLLIRFSPYFTLNQTGTVPAQKELNLVEGENYSAFAGDFDASGKSDIAFFDPDTGELIIVYNSEMNFSDAETFYIGEHKDFAQIASGDFTSNGYDDLAIRNPKTGEIKIVLNFGEGFDDKSEMYSFSWEKGDEYILMAGDFSNNGFSDLALWQSDEGKIHAVENKRQTSNKGTWKFEDLKSFTWRINEGDIPVTGDFR